MISAERISKVPISKIEHIDFSRRGISEQSLSNLIASIRETGVVNPILLQFNADTAMFDLVCGARRLYAAIRVDYEEIPARVIDEKLKEADAIRISILDNISHRKLNLIEQSNLLARLLDCDELGRDEILSGFMNLLGHEKSLKRLEMLISLGNLNPFFRDFTILNAVPLKVAYRIAKMKTEDQGALQAAFKGISISVSDLRESVETLIELSLIFKENISYVLKRNEIAAVLQSGHNIAAKVKDLKAALNRLRNPTVCAIQDEISKKLKRMDFGDIDVKLKDMDEGLFRLTVDFSSVEFLGEKINEIKREEYQTALSELIRVING